MNAALEGALTSHSLLKPFSRVEAGPYLSPWKEINTRKEGKGGIIRDKNVLDSLGQLCHQHVRTDVTSMIPVN